MEKTHYLISNEESKRIQILKFWFTIMVIFWHSYREEVRFADGDILMNASPWLEQIKCLISQVIVRCSVPGFFLLSAILLYRRDFRWQENIKKKLRTLMVPYFILNTFWIVFYFVGQSIPLTSHFFANQDKMIAAWGVKEYLDAYLGRLPNSDHTYYFPMLDPLWFVRDLFVLNIIAPALKRIIDRFPKLILTLLAAMLVFDIQTHIFFLSSMSLIYFCLGYYMIKYNRHLTDADQLPAAPVAAVYFISVIAALLTLNSAVNYLTKTLSVIIGIVFYFRFTTRFPDGAFKRGLLWISAYSFPIYLFHEPTLGILQKLAAKLLPVDTVFQALTYFGAPIITLAFCLSLSVFLEQFMPRLFYLLTGGRKKRTWRQ